MGKKKKNRLRSSRKREFTLLIANLNSSLGLVNCQPPQPHRPKHSVFLSPYYTHTLLVLFLWRILTDTDGTTSNIIPTKDGVMYLWGCPKVTLLWHDGLRLESRPLTLHKPLAELAFHLKSQTRLKCYTSDHMWNGFNSIFIPENRWDVWNRE